MASRTSWRRIPARGGCDEIDGEASNNVVPGISGVVGGPDLLSSFEEEEEEIAKGRLRRGQGLCEHPPAPEDSRYVPLFTPTFPTFSLLLLLPPGSFG